MISLKKISKIKNHSEKSIIGLLVPATLILAGAAFVLIGIERGEVGIVLRKAINICLECIGIG